MGSFASRPRLGTMIARLISRPMSVYLRRFPISAGKLRVWDNLVRPYLSWRPIQVDAVTSSGLRLRGPLSDPIHSAVYFFGVWEPALTRFIADSLMPGDVFIDIGANVGVHSMLAGKCVGASGRVHAIEASPTIYAILLGNIARNGIENVKTYNIAVADRSGTIPVFLHDPSNLGHTTVLQVNAEDTARYTRQEMVEARPLPEIIPTADILRARMIKIDVEGAEWPVIQGFAHLLPQLRSDVIIVVEVSRYGLANHGISFQQFLDFFGEHGYRAAQLPDHSANLCIYNADLKLLPVAEDFEVADLVFRRPAAVS